MRSMLQRLGIDLEHHVDFCMDGKEAVEKFKHSREQGLNYKLIFTDFSMPVMDGVKAT
jgi:CheY-like chemotaxis protein